MRVVAALGGNALLRRGEPSTAENQRANARAACRALAPVALEHELATRMATGHRSACWHCRALRIAMSRLTPSTSWARKRRG